METTLGDGATASCLLLASGRVVVGCDSGQLVSFDATSAQSIKAHEGGVLSVATTAGEMIVSGGADGCVALLQVGELCVVRRWLLSPRGGHTSGRYGVHVEHVAVCRSTWAALVGRAIAVGPIVHLEVSVRYLDLDRVADGLQMLPDATIVAAGIGGLKLWQCEADGGYQRAGPLVAARRPSEATLTQPGVADLPCDGWARSLAAAPDGSWLAASVSAAAAKSSLWLWRVADGADFECGGFVGPISGLQWSEDSRLLASMSGTEVLVWRFGETPRRGGAARRKRSREAGDEESICAEATAVVDGGAIVVGGGGSPAGRPPCRLVAESRVLSTAFMPGGPARSEPAASEAAPSSRLLACGCEDGSVQIFEVALDASSLAVAPRPLSHWRPACAATDADALPCASAGCTDDFAGASSRADTPVPVEHLHWLDPERLVLSGRSSVIRLRLVRRSRGPLAHDDPDLVEDLTAHEL